MIAAADACFLPVLIGFVFLFLRSDTRNDPKPPRRR